MLLLGFPALFGSNCERSTMIKNFESGRKLVLFAKVSKNDLHRDMMLTRETLFPASLWMSWVKALQSKNAC
jgi:hypothetical protein